MNKESKRLAMLSAPIIILGIVLDQVSKWLCVKYLKPKGSIPFIPKLINLTYCENTGAAFSMFSAPNQRWIFMVISTIAIVLMIYMLYSFKEKKYTLMVIGLSMMISGGVGNMIDRFRLGYVVDMIDVSPLFSFAIFNVADCFVCVGAGVMLLAFILIWKKEIEEQKNQSNPTSEEQ